jgi:hypothetical protein
MTGAQSNRDACVHAEGGALTPLAAPTCPWPHAKLEELIAPQVPRPGAQASLVHGILLARDFCKACSQVRDLGLDPISRCMHAAGSPLGVGQVQGPPNEALKAM